MILSTPHLRQVRRRMLESLAHCPPGTIGRNISTARWVQSMLGNLAVIALTAALFLGMYHVLVERMGHSLQAVLLGSTGLVVAITAALYIYYVYIVDSGTPSSRAPRESSSAAAKSKTN